MCIRDRFKNDKMRFQVEGEYQRAKLHNDQFFPSEYALDRTFQNVLPAARFEYKFSKTKNMELEYRARTDAPSIGQLQEVYNLSLIHI